MAYTTEFHPMPLVKHAASKTKTQLSETSLMSFCFKT